MPPHVSLGSVTLDCASPTELAQFWAAFLGGEVIYTSAVAVSVDVGGLLITAMRIDDYAAPTWPTGSVPKQIHLDLGVDADDLDEVEAYAVALGAKRIAGQPAADRRRVLLDPAGHPFCLTTQLPRGATAAPEPQRRDGRS